jgi:inhibitor of KinA
MEPLGDQGILVRFASEKQAAAFAEACRAADWDWLLDVVCAYATVAVFHDPARIPSGEAMRLLGELPLGAVPQAGLLHRIPCCYEFGPDLERVAGCTGMSVEEVIARHVGVEYTVYAIGFCPGFPYLGYLDARLSGVPRLPQPRLRVEPGSVALVGRQTGIYPLCRPGGWNIIGRTPLVLVDVEAGFFPIRAGDRVRFERIDAAEFRRLDGERLAAPDRPLPVPRFRPG